MRATTTIQLSRRFDGKKYMWNGRALASEEEAQETARKYSDDGFQVEVVVQDNEYYVFTRREIKEGGSSGAS